MKEHYFIVLDAAPSTYQLCRGTTSDAIGVTLAEGRTIKSLVAQVQPQHDVYRVYLARTDGKTGAKLIRKGETT
jgi:hypothetical protein